MRFASIAAAALLGLAAPAQASEAGRMFHFQVGDGVDASAHLVPDTIQPVFGPGLFYGGVLTPGAHPKVGLFGGAFLPIDRPVIKAPLPVPNVVPEPATWLLMILGFAGLALRLRGRKAIAQA